MVITLIFLPLFLFHPLFDFVFLFHYSVFSSIFALLTFWSLSIIFPITRVLSSFQHPADRPFLLSFLYFFPSSLPSLAPPVSPFWNCNEVPSFPLIFFFFRFPFSIFGRFFHLQNLFTFAPSLSLFYFFYFWSLLFPFDSSCLSPIFYILFRLFLLL